jgi:hypothetical protein
MLPAASLFSHNRENRREQHHPDSHSPAQSVSGLARTLRWSCIRYCLDRLSPGEKMEGSAKKEDCGRMGEPEVIVQIGPCGDYFWFARHSGPIARNARKSHIFVRRSS